MKASKSLLAALLLAAVALAVPGWAQINASDHADSSASDHAIASSAQPDPAPALNLTRDTAPVTALAAVSIELPHMAPELALQSFQAHAQWQDSGLAGYSAVTEINAELPDSAQKGDFELVRQFTAPNGLKFTPVRFTGDGFVKSNVIGRLLQSEVEHVERREGAASAISAANYKFSYKGAEKIEGRTVHVFQVKPRRKLAGLFKGRIYVDAITGTLRRAEGTLVKSPSFFIKKIEFVQDYADFGAFTFPVRTHSTALTRIVGRAVVDIFHRNYELHAVPGAETALRGGVLVPASFVPITDGTN